MEAAPAAGAVAGAPPNWNVLVPVEPAVEAAAAAPLAAVVVVAAAAGVEEAPNWNVLAGGVAVAADDAAPQLPNRDLAGVVVAELVAVEEAGAVSPPNRPALPPAAAAAGAGAAAAAAVAGAAAAWPKALLLFAEPKMFVKVGTAGLLSCTDVGADAPKMGLKPVAADVAAPNRPEEVIPAVAVVVAVPVA